MKRKTTKSRRVDRDIFGTPQNRSNTWGSKTNDKKKERKSIKKTLKKEIDLS